MRGFAAGPGRVDRCASSRFSRAPRDRPRRVDQRSRPRASPDRHRWPGRDRRGHLADAIAAELPALGRPRSGPRPAGGGGRRHCGWSWAGPTSTCCSAGGSTPAPCAGTARPVRSVRYGSLPSPVARSRVRPIRPRRPDAGGRAGGVVAGWSVPAGGRPAAGCRHPSAGRQATLARALPADRRWWLAATTGIDRVSSGRECLRGRRLDHPAAPAVSWAVRPGVIDPSGSSGVRILGR